MYILYVLEINKVYNEECLDGMSAIDDGSINLILCDLPYGTTENKWDSPIDLTKLWKQYKRVTRQNAAIILTAQCPFDKVLGASNLEMLRYEWIWEKEAGTGFLNAKVAPLKSHENILVFYQKAPTYNPIMVPGKPYKTKKTKPSSNWVDYRSRSQDGKGYDAPVVTENDGWRYPKTILRFDRDKPKLHPTQKPVALFEYLIQTYSDECDLVLDNCIGSGTTAIACLNTRRSYIGFEMDKTYFDLCVERISGHHVPAALPF
jgi:site-specific DNA-methyltransferase (adenine-specific)